MAAEEVDERQQGAQGMFLNSDYSKRFCQGDCAVVAGLSGVELAQRVIWEKTFDKELPQPVF